MEPRGIHRNRGPGWPGVPPNDRPKTTKARTLFLIFNIGSLTIRIGFRGPLCYNYNKEPPRHVVQAEGKPKTMNSKPRKPASMTNTDLLNTFYVAQ